MEIRWVARRPAKKQLLTPRGTHRLLISIICNDRKWIKYYFIYQTRFFFVTGAFQLICTRVYIIGIRFIIWLTTNNWNKHFSFVVEILHLFNRWLKQAFSTEFPAHWIYYSATHASTRLSSVVNPSPKQAFSAEFPAHCIYYSIRHASTRLSSVVKPSPKPTVSMSSGTLSHMGQSWLRTRDDLIQIMRLYLFPDWMAFAPCRCCPLWMIPTDILWQYSL